MDRLYCCWVAGHYILVILFSAAAAVSSWEPDEQRLYNQIMSSYLNTVRPAINNSTPLQVFFSMRLNQIVSLNERQQVLTTNAFIDQSWTDPALSWDPAEFKDVRSLRVPADQVWKPDTFIYNNVDNGSTGFIHGTYIQIRHTGGVAWPVPVRMRSSCVVKIAYFPFDYQLCMVKFGSWIYSHALVDYTVRADVVSVDLSTYIKNSEWELVSMRLEKSIANKTRGLGLHPHLTAILYLKRNTFYYLFNIIVPCVMLSLLTLMTFWLPPTSGEKVTLGLSVFLAFSMFMLLIAEEVPASSDAVPIIGIYLCVVMTMTSLSVICAVLVTNLHNRGSKLKPAPRWLASLFIRYLAVPFCVSQDVQLLANTIHLSDYCQFFILHDNRCERMEKLIKEVQAGNDIKENTLHSSTNKRDSVDLEQSATHQQNLAKYSRNRLHLNHPSLHQQHGYKLYLPEQDVLQEQVGEEELALEPMEQMVDSPLLQKSKPGSDSHYTPYKSVCTHDEDCPASSCSDKCELQESVIDATIPTVIIQESCLSMMEFTKTSPDNTAIEKRTEKFDKHYQITPCKTHETFCDCSNSDEVVWVHKNDLMTSSHDISESQRACHTKTDSNTEVLQVLIPELHTTTANSQTSEVSSSVSPSRQRRRYRRQRRKTSSPLYENPKLAIKRARVMIAEWCTIAKVVDRILFTLSLLATMFAYVFILIVVPANNKIMTQNVTVVNYINTSHNRWN